MTKIAQTNVNGINYAVSGASLTGTCSSPASDYMKLVTLTDSDSIEDGVTIACTFAHENSAGTAPSSLTLYSADQIHFYTDAGMTELYTLAPSGCFELTYTGSGNAYSYISYPVVAVGTLSGIVSAPVCDSHGNVTSRRLWKAGDVVFLQYKSRKFFVMNDGSGNSTAGVAFKGTRSAYNTAKLIPEGSDGHIPSGALVIITDEGKTYVTNGTGSSQTLELVANATFNGSHAEWNSLTLAQKAMYNIVNFTDDAIAGVATGSYSNIYLHVNILQGNAEYYSSYHTVPKGTYLCICRHEIASGTSYYVDYSIEGDAVVGPSRRGVHAYGQNGGFAYSETLLKSDGTQKIRAFGYAYISGSLDIETINSICLVRLI